MAHTFKNHHFHLIWSTKLRENIIDPTFQDRLYAYMGGIIRENKTVLVEIGGIANHVHLLIGMNTLDNYSETIRKIKGGSSSWLNKEIPLTRKFGWQEGFASFSVSYSTIDSVRKYIQNQEEHHKHQTFEDEYLKFLDLHGIQYDKRFVFD